MKIAKMLAAGVMSAAVAAAMVVAAGAETAGIGFQTNTWCFRDNFGQDTCVFWDDTWAEEEEAGEFDNGFVAEGFEYVNADITADGTYDISVSGIPTDNLSQTGANTAWNFIKLTTDIDGAAYPDLKITINSFKIGDKEYGAGQVFDLDEATENTKISLENVESKEFMNKDKLPATIKGSVVNLVNSYGDDDAMVKVADSEFATTISVNFTVEGFKAAETEAPETDAPETDAPETDAPTTGDTSKPSTDTGVEGIAVVAGVAVIATGAAIVAKKRK